MRAMAVATIVLVSACATTPPAPSVAPRVQGAVIDADPGTLQIEIGRYSALLGQVVEHTGVTYEHAASDEAQEGAQALMAQLSDAVEDYNTVRAALCASRAQPTYPAIRAASCTAHFHPGWSDRGALSFETIATRSNEAGASIIGLWDEVCGEAKRLQPLDQKDEPVCPME